MAEMIRNVVVDMQDHIDAIAPRFRDRSEAGDRLLNQVVSGVEDTENMPVISIALGGVAVALPFWERFDRMPKVLPISKILADERDDRFGVGAITEGSASINYELVDFLGMSDEKLEHAKNHARSRLLAKTSFMNQYLVDSNDMREEVLLVDDGVASGFTLLEGIEALRAIRRPSVIHVAAPIMHETARRTLELEGHVVHALHVADGPGFVVDGFYESFDQQSPEQVRQILDEYMQRRAA